MSILFATACSGASVMPAASSVGAGAKTSAMFNDPQGIAKSRDEANRSGPDGPSNTPTVPESVLDRSESAPADAGVDGSAR